MVSPIVPPIAMIFILIDLLVLVVEEVAKVFRVVRGLVLVVEEVVSVIGVVGCSLVQMVVVTSSHKIIVKNIGLLSTIYPINI